MKRMTAGAATVITAVVLAGGGVGVAMAYDGQPTHPGGTPAAAARVPAAHPTATMAVGQVTSPLQQSAAVGPPATHRTEVHAPAAVQQRHSVTTQNRPAVRQFDHRTGSGRDCDDWGYSGARGNGGGWDQHR